MKYIIICLLLFSVSVANAINGKVISIADGDTLTLLAADNQQIKVRFAGIDCPEKNQAYGTKAKQALSGKVFGRQVTLKNTSKDRYGRTVLSVDFDGDIIVIVDIWDVPLEARIKLTAGFDKFFQYKPHIDGWSQLHGLGFVLKVSREAKRNLELYLLHFFHS